MNKENNILIFEQTLGKVNRPGMNELIAYIRESDFYNAPASTRYHLSIKGGLLQHSINVYKALKEMMRDNHDGTYSYMCAGEEVDRVSEDTLIVVGLLHDICKINTYGVEKRNRKNKLGAWESYDFYVVDEKFPYGHGEKSVLIISNFIKLLPQEQMAIRWHMGFPDDFAGKAAYGSSVEKYPIILAVNTADMLASRCMEKQNCNKSEFE